MAYADNLLMNGTSLEELKTRTDDLRGQRTLAKC